MNKRIYENPYFNLIKLFSLKTVPILKKYKCFAISNQNFFSKMILDK